MNNNNFENFNDHDELPLPNPADLNSLNNDNFIAVVEGKINQGLTPAEFWKLSDTLNQVRQRHPELQKNFQDPSYNLSQTPIQFQQSTQYNNVQVPLIQTPIQLPQFKSSATNTPLFQTMPLPSTPSNISKPSPLYPPVTPTRLIKDVLLRKNRRKSVKVFNFLISNN